MSDGERPGRPGSPETRRGGPPAAKIPHQVKSNEIKARAARLGEAGAEQVEKHLAQQICQTRRILMENPHMGRTEQFTEVTFKTAQTEGAIVEARISGITGDQLTA